MIEVLNILQQFEQHLLTKRIVFKADPALEGKFPGEFLLKAEPLPHGFFYIPVDSDEWFKMLAKSDSVKKALGDSFKACMRKQEAEEEEWLTKIRRHKAIIRMALSVGGGIYPIYEEKEKIAAPCRCLRGRKSRGRR